MNTLSTKVTANHQSRHFWAILCTVWRGQAMRADITCHVTSISILQVVERIRDFERIAQMPDAMYRLSAATRFPTSHISP